MTSTQPIAVFQPAEPQKTQESEKEKFIEITEFDGNPIEKDDLEAESGESLLSYQRRQQISKELLETSR